MAELEKKRVLFVHGGKGLSPFMQALADTYRAAGHEVVVESGHEHQSKGYEAQVVEDDAQRLVERFDKLRGRIATRALDLMLGDIPLVRLYRDWESFEHSRVNHYISKAIEVVEPKPGDELPKSYTLRSATQMVLDAPEPDDEEIRAYHEAIRQLQARIKTRVAASFYPDLSLPLMEAPKSPVGEYGFMLRAMPFKGEYRRVMAGDTTA